MKRFSKLALRFVVGFLLLGILICAACSLVGFFNYKESIESQYNTTAYQIAEVALSYVGEERAALLADAAKGYREGTVSKERIDELTSSPEYAEAKSRLEELRRDMGANDIFFVYTDLDVLRSYAGTKEGWTPLSYLLDCYNVPELNYSLGDVGPFNPDFIEDALYVNETGNRADNYFVSKSEFGYNTSAMLPVKDASGRVIATVGVEIPMETIRTDLRTFLLYALLSTAAVVVLFIAAYMLYLYFRVISPINQVSKEVSSFVENGTALSDGLKKIRTGDEIETLAFNTVKMQQDIQNYIGHITSITAEKERIGAELDVANHIQRSMLPCIFPAFPDREEFEIYATMDPAKEVGGDFYDFFMVDERHLAIVMADVSGKGIPAALFMVIGKTLIKDHTVPGADLGSVFAKVNDLLCQSNSEGLFITAFEGVLDLVTGQFDFVNAGHEPPFICRAGSTFEMYKIRPGFVLAGMEGTRYTAGSITLDVGDKLFQYTDGVTEASDTDEKLFGMDRLHDVLNRVKDCTPFEILPAVKDALDAFVGEAPQFDDITMLALEYKKKMEEN